MAMVAGLNGLGEREWKELAEGRAWSEQSLARALGPYGIVPRTVWMAGKSAKGYLLEEIREESRKYGGKGEG